MLGDAENPLPVGYREGERPGEAHVRRSRLATEALRPAVRQLVLDYGADSALDALASWIMTLSVELAGSERAAAMFESLARACPTIATLKEAEGSA